jgi:hypothetical protein
MEIRRQAHCVYHACTTLCGFHGIATKSWLNGVDEYLSRLCTDPPPASANRENPNLSNRDRRIYEKRRRDRQRGLEEIESGMRGSPVFSITLPNPGI